MSVDDDDRASGDVAGLAGRVGLRSMVEGEGVGDRDAQLSGAEQARGFGQRGASIPPAARDLGAVLAGAEIGDGTTLLGSPVNSMSSGMTPDPAMSRAASTPSRSNARTRWIRPGP